MSLSSVKEKHIIGKMLSPTAHSDGYHKFPSVHFHRDKVKYNPIPFVRATVEACQHLACHVEVYLIHPGSAMSRRIQCRPDDVLHHLRGFIKTGEQYEHLTANLMMQVLKMHQ